MKKMPLEELMGRVYKVLVERFGEPIGDNKRKGVGVSDERDIEEVAPPGKEKMVKALKKKGDVDNPWAVAWSKHNKEHGKSKKTNEVNEEHSYDRECSCPKCQDHERSLHDKVSADKSDEKKWYSAQAAKKPSFKRRNEADGETAKPGIAKAKPGFTKREEQPLNEKEGTKCALCNGNGATVPYRGKFMICKTCQKIEEPSPGTEQPRYPEMDK